MMAISAQKNKVHVAIASWEWGSYFDPKLKLKGIKLKFHHGEDHLLIQFLGTQKPQVYI